MDIRITGRGDTSVPVTRMSRDGGDYLQWTADGKRRDVGVGRAVLPPAD